MVGSKVYNTLTPIDPQCDQRDEDNEAKTFKQAPEEETVDFSVQTDMEGHEYDEEFRPVAIIYANLMSGKISLLEVNSLQILSNVQDRVRKDKDSMQDLRMAKLGLQYMMMIDIVRRFLRAE